MKLKHVTINVEKMEKSIHFYQNIVGLEITRRFSPSVGVEIVFLGDGGTEIELIYREGQNGKEKISVGENISLGFEVNSISEMMDILRRDDFMISEVVKPTPEMKFFYTKDPSGVKIQFFELSNGSL